MKAVAVVAVALLVSLALGQDKKDDKMPPINPDRPDQTNGAGITPVGKIVLETGYRQTHTSGSTLHEWGDQPLFRYGINQRFEARIVAPAYAVSSSDKGWEDSNVGFKWLLKDGGDGGGFSKPSLAVQGGTSIPTGSGSFRSKRSLPSIVGIVDFDLGNNGDLGVNVGAAEQLNSSGGSFTLYLASASYNHTISGPLAAYLEGYMLMPSAGNGPTGHFADGGFQYLLTNDCMLDLSAGTQLDQHQQTAYFAVGASFRF